MAIFHVVPIRDLIVHERDNDDCPCGPDVEILEADDGQLGLLIVHHSLDGRELTEPGAS